MERGRLVNRGAGTVLVSSSRSAALVTVVGWVAVVLTQVFWIPNIARILRTRDVDGYSLLAWVVMTAGLSSWLVYFIARGDVVGTVANVSGVSGAALTTGLVWRWRKPKAVVATVHSIAVSKETAGEMEQAGEVA